MNVATTAQPLSTSSTSATDTQAQLKHKKLVDAAQSFEGSFMGEMLKSFDLSKGIDGSDSDDSDADSGSDTMNSYGREALAKAISSAGGFGVARSVVAQVERQQASLTSAVSR